MKLFYAPGACSLGIHVILEEIGKPYETEIVKLAEGAQHQPHYAGINPKGKVPALLRDDGKILTEFPVIAQYLAETAGTDQLLPREGDTRFHVLEVMDYIVSTVHMQGYTRLFRPGHFGPPEVEDVVKKRGKEIVDKGLAQLSQDLDGNEYLGGRQFSIGDAALFYVEYWTAKRMNATLPEKLAGHFERMMQRPAVQAVLRQEGLA